VDGGQSWTNINFLTISEVEVLEAEAHRDKILAAIEADKAAIDKTALQLSYARVLAPISGRIGRSLVDVGNLVGAGSDKTLPASIANDESIFAYFNISERTLLDFEQRALQASRKKEKEVQRQPHPIFLGLQNEEGFPHEGEMDFISNRLDPDTGTIELH
jgi:multidrug efflux pump subunit AcrA (membrane-fusion protein)